MGSHRTGWIHGCLAFGPLIAAALIVILLGASCGDDDDDDDDDDYCTTIEECVDSPALGLWEFEGYDLVGEEDCEAQGIHISVPKVGLTADWIWVVAELRVTFDNGGPYFLRSLGADHIECYETVDGTHDATFAASLHVACQDEFLVVLHIAPGPQSCTDVGPFVCAFNVTGLEWPNVFECNWTPS